MLSGDNKTGHSLRTKTHKRTHHQCECDVQNLDLKEIKKTIIDLIVSNTFTIFCPSPRVFLYLTQRTVGT